MSPLGWYGPGKINLTLRPTGTLLFGQHWSKGSGREGQEVLEDLAGSDLSTDGAPAEAGTRPVCWHCRRSRRCQERAASSDTSDLLQGESVRALHGSGRWDREQKGSWLLTHRFSATFSWL